MKAVRFIAVLAAAALFGCNAADQPAEPSQTAAAVQPSAFGGARIRINGLTQIALRPADRGDAALTACVDVFDAYDSRIKAPGRFRFELYEFVPRSSEPRGKRLMIWPDIDLTDPEANNGFWQDYLRTYQFTLDMDFLPGSGNTFILEATCTTPAGKRLTDLRQIHYGG
ncbi:MAG: hypothetical protein IH624_18375 [Phycisphaerae bacterium]|nr:hypothetical protein [Phycisphaerae bacterium]